MKALKNTFRKGKTVIVLSDLHLGAGEMIEGRRNLLEDFFFDRELINLFKYFSNGVYEDRVVEIVLNGDFLDFLATPYVNAFEDTFWSEDTAVQKLEMIREAHREVFNAINNYLKKRDKYFVYNVGNHDAEILLPKVRVKFLSLFSEEVRSKIIFPSSDVYSPMNGVFIQHGHQYERAHDFDVTDAMIIDNNGMNYIKPTWGAYYCLNIVNKYKVERSYINQIQPIKKFLMHGLLFDTLFTLRFMFSNATFFIMVRLFLWSYYLKRFDFRSILHDLKSELEMFQNYETLTRKFFQENSDAKILLTGHTHHPIFRHFKDGTTFVNTGTWTKIISLDFSFNF
jgi:UDP-2,3-diacylglucosamine pyrophosphatase LpxH